MCGRIDRAQAFHAEGRDFVVFVGKLFIHLNVTFVSAAALVGLLAILTL